MLILIYNNNGGNRMNNIRIKIQKKIMCFLMVFVFLLGLGMLNVYASNIEKFNDEADNSKIFSAGGETFDITGNYLHIENNLVEPDQWGYDDRWYVENINSPMSEATVVGSFKMRTNYFNVNSIYLIPLNNERLIVSQNNIAIRGKLEGNQEFEYILLYSDINTDATNNYYTFVDLSSYSSYEIDELEFEVIAYNAEYCSYIMLDDFNFTTVIKNTEPVLTVTNSALSYTENQSAVQIDAEGTISDADGDADWNGGKLEVQITSNAESGDEISISDTDGDPTIVTISGTNILVGGTDIGDLSASGGVVTGGTKLTITFDSDASNASIQEVLQSVRYRTTSDSPGTSNRTVTFIATDKNAASASGARIVSVSSVDDVVPSIVNNTGLTLDEGATATIPTSKLLATDEDTDDTTLTYTVTTPAEYGQLENTDNIGVSISSFTHQNLIDNKIQYVHDSSNTISDSFIFKVTDGVPNELTGQTFNITVNPVPDDVTIDDAYYTNNSLATNPFDIAAIDEDAVITVSTVQPITFTGENSVEIDCTIAGANINLDGIRIYYKYNSSNEECALAFTGTGNHLIIKGENYLRSGLNEPGIKVEVGTEVTISEHASTGAINVGGGDYAAGIGSGYNSDAGTINILSGEIAAYGSYCGTGIGGGSGGDGGTINISGGAIEAHGHHYAAGIGGGYNGHGGTINISGGTVTADSAATGAGVGGGSSGDSGNITISGGTVIANAGQNAAGIGGGSGGSGENITITGGTVRATGGNYSGAGIGGGSSGDGGNIVISGGNVVATSTSKGAGIGGGENGNGGTVVISNGAEVYAKGDSSNSVVDIGSGPSGTSHGALTISGTETKVFLSQDAPFDSTPSLSDGIIYSNLNIETKISGVFGSPDPVADAVYAVPPTYTVTFNSDNKGITPTPQAIVENGLATSPGALTETGYTFGGWYTELGCTNVVDFSANILADKTYFSKWTPIEYTIIYNLDGGANDVSNPANYTIESAEISLEDATKTAYTFGGWYDNSEMTGSAITTIETGSTGNKGYYAKWTPTEYTITYNLDGGSNDVSNPANYTIESAEISLEDATKTGYTFGGWYDNSELTGSAITTIASGSTWNEAYYAKWTPVEYSITYNLDGGINNVSNPAIYTIKSAEINIKDATKTGYSFSGWYDNSELVGSAITTIASGETGAKAFYAKWTSNTSTSSSRRTSSSSEQVKVDTNQNEDGPTEITAKVDIVIKGDKQVANIEKNTIEALVKVATSTEESGEQAIIKIDIASTSKTNNIEVAIPRTSFNNIVNDTDATMKIEHDMISLAFDSKTLETINQSGASGDVSISVETVDKESLPEEILEKLANMDIPVFDFTVKKGNEQVSDFHGGKVKVSIPYTLKENQQTNAIVVYFLNDNGELEKVKGRYNPDTGNVDFETNHFSKYLIGYNHISFDDTKVSDWFYNAVTFIAAREITNGTSETTFSPNKTIVRAEFVTLLVRYFELTSENLLNYNDVKPEEWFAESVRIAKGNNILPDIYVDEFEPYKAITREEMMYILHKVIIETEIIIEDKEIAISSFKDIETISEYAFTGAEYLVSRDIIHGYNEKINPADTATRAEVAMMLYNVISVISK